jgi:3-dehydroquinate dehydratase
MRNVELAAIEARLDVLGQVLDAVLRVLQPEARQAVLASLRDAFDGAPTPADAEADAAAAKELSRLL